MEEYLKQNPDRLPLVIAELLTHDLSPLEKPILLFNSQLSSHTCREYSQSLSWLERYAIACNPNTPEDIIQKLTQDGNKIVGAVAKSRL